MAVSRIGMLLVAWLIAASASAAQTPKERIILLGGGGRYGLFLADADGSNERPLLPGSTLEYDPSFSADGQWVVFTSERSGSADIYRVHPDGTGLQQLTRGPFYDDQGALSPDGRILAFVSTRGGGKAHIWLLELATQNVRELTPSDSGNFRPSWSPDGRWIAFTSDRDQPHLRSGPGKPPPAGFGCCGWELVQSTALYLVHAGGSGLRRLTPIDGFAGSPKWSADSQRIVYYEALRGKISSQMWAGITRPLTGSWRIATIDINSGAKQDLTSGEDLKLSPQYLGGNRVGYVIRVNGKTALADTSGKLSPQRDIIWNPSWSPDGKYVVYAKPLEGTITGSSQVVPASRTDSDFDFYQASDWISYSPDGRRFVYADVPHHALMLADASGSVREKLYEDPRGDISLPKWSPDGRYIAFTLGRLSTRNPVVSSQLALIRADGSDLKVLTSGQNNSAYASFSPDGKRLVYRVLGQEHGLRLLSLENARVTKLTTEWDNFPEWSPSDDRILFTGLRTGDFEIYSIRPDGTDLRQLTRDHGNDAHAIWSPDGRSILFTSSRTGWKDEAMLSYAGPQSYGKLFIMRADGSGLRQVTDDQWEEAPVAWLPGGPTH